jgi:hypothetical protein
LAFVFSVVIITYLDFSLVSCCGCTRWIMKLKSMESIARTKVMFKPTLLQDFASSKNVGNAKPFWLVCDHCACFLIVVVCQNFHIQILMGYDFYTIKCCIAFFNCSWYYFMLTISYCIWTCILRNHIYQNHITP